MSKPTILFVTGSFASPNFYDNIVKLVTDKGYEIQVVQLRTVNKKPGALPTMYDDASYIAALATELADQGKDVVLMSHSYGGTPATQAMEGLSKSARAKEGKKGGVVRLAYMTAVVPAEGVAAGGHLTDPDVPPTTGAMVPDADGWLIQPNPDLIADMVFNHLSHDEGLAAARKFSQHSSVSFANELTYPGYKDVPVSYLFCEEDECVSPKIQQKGIDAIEAASGSKVDVKKIPSDHCPSYTHPELALEWIISVADKAGEE
ncbi:alpha/beta-hydrolase [Lophiostoma macrostomum CBS 122681]|uniref:Alpha/beta-hydrolase n=1 Tax=Lophiostoma macrostomum CBS 122681 TaxID=1314788 RepID=A0A6A6TS98_9PLEO|nr:alpha/beta-hydrolase [Lophiostoma macrostomum CBS 122681]